MSHFDLDAFISYAHLDNEPLESGEKGWVTRFHATLQTRLASGSANRRRSGGIRSSPATTCSATRSSTSSRAALLISIVTPRYLRSDWCLKELNKFAEAAAQTGGVTVGNKSRVIKVVKTARKRVARGGRVRRDRAGRAAGQWGVSDVRVKFVHGYASQTQIRQFEIWLARPNDDLDRLFQSLISATKDERVAAAQTLQTKYASSPAAIALALGLLAPDRIDALSADGRMNLLYFLTRTAPAAWSPSLELLARERLAWAAAQEKLARRWAIKPGPS